MSNNLFLRVITVVKTAEPHFTFYSKECIKLNLTVMFFIVQGNNHIIKFVWLLHTFHSMSDSRLKVYKCPVILYCRLKAPSY